MTVTQPARIVKRVEQRRLSEVAKHLVKPPEIVDSDWRELRGVCEHELGVVFDKWQNGVAYLALGRAPNGMLAATVGGVGLSVMRQVGKTFCFAAILVTLCIKRKGLKVVWTAQHNRTNTETFLQMQEFCKKPRVARFIEQIFLGSGDEEIRFTNGARILFGARERGFGRGIPKVDVMVFDEAQILSEKALENMLAAMNQSTLGLHVYIGTPPKPTDDSESFTRMRMEALASEATGDPVDLVWIEIGADVDADIDDPDVYSVNPSFPHWTPLESMLRLRKKLGVDGFRREGLGIWPGASGSVFDLARWLALEVEVDEAPRHVVLTVAVGRFRGSAAIGVAGEGPDGRTVLFVMCADGVGWVAGKVAQLVSERDVVEVALLSGEARGLAGDLTRLGVEFVKPAENDVAASCTAIQAAVSAGTACHLGQPELDSAVAKARTRRQGSAETWDLEVTSPAIVAVGAAFHRWGLQESPLPAIY